MSPILEDDEDVWRCTCPMDHMPGVLQCCSCGDDDPSCQDEEWLDMDELSELLGYEDDSFTLFDYQVDGVQTFLVRFLRFQSDVEVYHLAKNLGTGDGMCDFAFNRNVFEPVDKERFNHGEEDGDYSIVYDEFDVEYAASGIGPLVATQSSRCGACGWTCDFPCSHLEYSRHHQCSFIEENYEFHVDGENEEVVYKNKRTGLSYRIGF